MITYLLTYLLILRVFAKDLAIRGDTKFVHGGLLSEFIYLFILRLVYGQSRGQIFIHNGSNYAESCNGVMKKKNVNLTHIYAAFAVPCCR